MKYDHFETKLLLVLQQSEACRVKLATTMRKTCGWFSAGIGLLNPFLGEFEFVNNVEGEVAVDVRGLVVDFLVLSVKSEDFRCQNSASVA